MKKIILHIIILMNTIAFSQAPLKFFSQDVPNIFDLFYQTEGIDGHKYFADQWEFGQLIINDTIIAAQSRIQYDMVSGEPIIGNIYKEDKGFILRDKSITGFVINNSSFIKVAKKSLYLLMRLIEIIFLLRVFQKPTI